MCSCQGEELEGRREVGDLMDRFGVVFVWLEERFRKKIRQRCTALDSIALLPIYHLNTKQALLFGLLILLQ